MAKASGLMWHDVPNRGGRPIVAAERGFGDIGLSSAWQGDNPARDRHARADQPRTATTG